MEKADIIIIGAGVAGLFTALKVDKKYKVIIVEKQAFPHDKLCGGLMCEDAYNFIKPLNPPPSIFYSPATLQISVADHDNNFAFTPDQTFHNLNRRGFYRWIKTLLGNNVFFKNLSKPGKIFFDGNTFQIIITDQEKIENNISAPVLIGADGVNSHVRRSFFSSRPGYIHLVQFTSKPSRPVNKGFFLFDKSITGKYYSWVIPRDNEIVCGTSIEGSNYKQLPERFPDEYGIQKNWHLKKAHPVTKIDSLEEIILGDRRLLLVGEAAGLVRPSSGEGLTLALQSAEYAAAAIQAAVKNPAEEYIKLCSQIFPLLKKDIKVAQMIFEPDMRKNYFSGIGMRH